MNDGAQLRSLQVLHVNSNCASIAHQYSEPA
jgi:hypothetical protein